VAADVRRTAREQRAGEEREAELRVGCTEVLLRPDPDEDPGRGAGGRVDERDGEHRPQRRLDVRPPDEPVQAGDEAHPPTVPATRRRLVRKNEHEGCQHARDPCDGSHGPIIFLADCASVSALFRNR
jgi:hypothetical protein